MHGHIVRKHSGASVKAHVEKYGRAVMIGHCHRFGEYAVTFDGKELFAYENGCLADEALIDYDTSPNWQVGWSVVQYAGPRYHVQQVSVRNGQYMWEGQLFGDYVNTRQAVPVLT
jgi:hypothetical protein